MVTVRLTRQQLEECDAIASDRQVSKDAVGVIDRKVGSGTGRSLHLIGAKGEKALESYLGTKMIHFWGSPRGDGGYVDQFYGGKSIQIKSTPYSGGRLLFFKVADFQADMAVLMVVGDEWVKIVGWCTREDFQAKHHIEDIGKGVGPQPMMEQKDLRPIEELRALAFHNRH